MDKIIALFVLLICASCQKDEYFGPVNPSTESGVVEQSSNLIYIGCEGNFQYGNASLSAINLEENTIENDVFQRVNGFGIGDVLQSMLHVGDSLFLVVNNSGLIRIVNDSTFEEIAVIEGFNSPRYMLMVGGHRALVSDYGGKTVSVVDLVKAKITGQIPAPLWTERMTMTENRIYISAMTDSSLVIIDKTTLEMEAKINLGIQPNYLFTLNGEVIVCGNGKAGSRILSIDQLNQISDIHSFDSRLSGASFYGENAYLLFRNTLVQLNLMTFQSRSFEHKAQTPYSVFVDQSGVYISDVLDYLSKGKVLVYDDHFEHKSTYRTGLIPQAFAR